MHPCAKWDVPVVGEHGDSRITQHLLHSYPRGMLPLLLVHAELQMAALGKGEPCLCACFWALSGLPASLCALRVGGGASGCCVVRLCRDHVFCIRFLLSSMQSPFLGINKQCKAE